MLQVLNPWLYTRLQQLFGKVGVHNPRSGMRGQRFRDVLSGREMFRMDVRGETYSVRCLFCETADKLWINHTYATEVEAANTRKMFKCFKCEAQKDPLKVRLLWNYIIDNDRNLIAAQNSAALVVPTEPEPWQLRDDIHAPLPTRIVSLSDLPEGHHARNYIKYKRPGGGHNPDFLAKYYGLGYCEPPVLREKCDLALNRIFIPVFLGEYLRSWQTRYIEDGAERKLLKYFALPEGSPKRWLYAMDHARPFPWCVVVEGAPSVWRMGPPMVGLFGASATEDQVKWLEHLWPHGCVLMPDDDWYEGDTPKAKHDNAMAQERRSILLKKIKQRLPNSFELTLPRNTDHEMYRPADVWQWILSETAKRGWPQFTPPFLQPEIASQLLVTNPHNEVYDV